MTTPLDINISVTPRENGSWSPSDPDGLYVPPEEWNAGEPPVITGVSGTFANGNTVTLTGSNFSTGTVESAMLDFDDAAVGERTGQLYYWSGGGAEYLITDTADSPFGGSCISSHPIQQTFNTAHYELANDSDSIFVEAWARINRVVYEASIAWDSVTSYSIGDYINQVKPAGTGAGATHSFLSNTNSNVNNSPYDGSGNIDTTNWTKTDAAQIKLFRVVDDVGEASMQARPLSMNLIIESNDDLVNEVRPSVGGTTGWYGTSQPDEVWVKYTMFMKKGDLDTANGERYCKVGTGNRFTYSGSTVPPGSGGHMASPTALVDRTEYSGEPIINHVSGTAAYHFRRIPVPYFQRNHQESIVDVAHMFISTSEERVVIGDASTWAACDHTKSYICDAERTLGEIAISAKESTLIDGDAYAYVVNHDGLYNETGVLVRSAA